MKNIFPVFPVFKNKALNFLLLVFVLLSFSGLRSQTDLLAPLVDKKATASTLLLSKKLQAISKQGFAVGHQDASSYGIGWKHNDHPEKIDSDVHRVLGDFPAVFGFDIGGIELDSPDNLDSVPFDAMRKLIIDAHAKAFPNTRVFLNVGDYAQINDPGRPRRILMSRGEMVVRKSCRFVPSEKGESEKA